MPKPLPVGVVEVKREEEDPLKGMQQARAYADCKRFDVKYVFASNGHRYGEFDLFTSLQSGPFAFADFPTHTDLTARYAKDTGLDLAQPQAAMLFQADSPAWAQSRYYQDAAIRAAFEKIIRCQQNQQPARVLLALATGSGKTIIATNLLWRLSQAAQLPKPALFLCDRDELREQAYTKLRAAFGDNARIVKTEKGQNAAKNARIHIATYQTLGLDDDDNEGFATFLTEHCGDDAFSVIIIDECHHLHRLDIDTRTGPPNPHASRKQRIMGRTMTAVEKVRVDSEANLRDILDKVHQINIDHVDDQHFFTLSQVYEDLLLKMGEKNSDGGQFFTPREVIRAMVHTAKPTQGQTVYDPCCGTGGFLAIAYEHMARQLGASVTSTDIDQLKHDTFFGREKENLVFPIALANLVLHGIDQPNLWHGNALTRRATYGALFDQAPKTFDVILTNPPFGGKEGKDAQKNFSFETSATQVLFVQNILAELAPNGTCAIVLDEGLLFRTNESAFVETKRKLVDECDVWAIVSLPGGVFSTAGAGVKTNLLFFTKGQKTSKTWYYDLSGVKVGKKTPLTLAHFGFAPDGAVLADAQLTAVLTAGWREDESNSGQSYPSYARLLQQRGTPQANSRYSWTVDFAARRAQARAQAQPLLDEAAHIKSTLIDLREALKRLKKDKVSAAELAAQEAKVIEKDQRAHELDALARDIDAAVFDLKAVNPTVVTSADERTPGQIIGKIAEQGRVVSESLGRLAALIGC
ncbi:MAG: N-6 DNA methylase [Comamonadaceae bacterium]|nr:N-6 DNA methylase [Comamonadaceae bacterium]